MSTVRYHVRHRTAYVYSGRIDLCHSLAHLAPREEVGQEILAHHLDVSPAPHYQMARKDYFGNGTNYFAIQGSHAEFAVISTFTVEKSDLVPVLPDSGLSWDRAWNRRLMVEQDETGICFGNYLLPTASCPSLEDIDAFLAPSLKPGREIMDLVNELMARIYTEFDYVPGATDNSTPLQVVLEQRKGVCQDFAHVMIAALRRINIPARYVSGYLETIPPPGVKKLQGADASHAWVEVHSPAGGWIGFDPTNNKIPGHQHIKIAHGRDYFDVRPLRGTFLGSGGQKLSVEVDVERV
ncbi:MAG: transglutaminase family protein [Verrucomicrobia bacterium]|nr:transglutaminase family protein [Verrucomicrobiota bacterium]MDA1005109.1 transglutaminase family protein [Verrucomicrobiota bacterium]